MLFSPDLYAKAMRFAASAHGDQKVPGRTWPYVVHLAGVAMEVAAALPDCGLSDPDLAIQCAVLHDVLEDTEVGADALEAAFGGAVRRGVEALSHNTLLPREQRLADTLRRIREQPAEIAAVKLADRIWNLGPPPEDWSEEKRRAYHGEAELIHRELADRCPVLAERLRRKIEDYRRYFR